MINIVYLSGTGNTQYILDLMKENFEGRKESVNLIPIHDAMNINTLEGDIFGIAYPIYGFSTPSIMTKWAKKLKHGNQKVFIINTGADFIGINHNAPRTMTKLLSKKGYDVFYNRILVMPSNWLMAYDDAFIKQLTNASVAKVNDVCENILKERRRLYRPSLAVKIIAPAIGYLEDRLGARLFGKTLKTTSDCIRCEDCVKTCPTDNIELKNNQIIFHYKCISCMKCIYACKQEAIRSRGYSFCILKNGYNLKKVIDDPSIKPNFVTQQTKGYFKHFYDYLNDPTK